MTDRSNDRQRLESEVSALTEVAKTLTAPLDLPELLEAVLHRMAEVLEPAEAERDYAVGSLGRVVPRRRFDRL